MNFANIEKAINALGEKVKLSHLSPWHDKCDVKKCTG